MDDLRLSALIRAVRLKRGLRQIDVASSAGVSQSSICLIERGHWQALSINTLRRVALALDIRVDVSGRWRGGEADRLLSRTHSQLAESFARTVLAHPTWTVEPEVSFSNYGERGVIDQLAWHAGASHLLVVELKTKLVDINELIGTLDRKARLATQTAATRGWRARYVSVWVVVLDNRTNRRHVAEHSTMLRAKYPTDGRHLRAFLRNPTQATRGLAFMTNMNGGNCGQHQVASPRRGRAVVAGSRPAQRATQGG
jgi:transcriptional regulator with XRE-family HTH domain